MKSLVLFVLFLLVVVVAATSTIGVQAAPAQPEWRTPSPTPPTPTPTPTAPATGCPLDAAPWECESEALPEAAAKGEELRIATGPVWVYGSDGIVRHAIDSRSAGVFVADLLVPDTFTTSRVTVTLDATVAHPERVSIYLAHAGRMDLLAFNPSVIQDTYTLDLAVPAQGIWSLAFFYNHTDVQLRGYSLTLR